MKNFIALLTSLVIFTGSVCAQLHFVKMISVTSASEGGSARPEIVAKDNRVFVLYLGNIENGNNRTFDLKIYNHNLDSVINSKTLVSTTAQYGGPTDIRIASDNQYLYAFYETNKQISPSSETYLWGVKYALNDNFDKVVYTSSPITVSKPLTELQDGGELLDDPAPLVGPNSVFIITRLKYSLARSGHTIYRVREFSKNDLNKLSEFDLDLSNAASGRARVASLLYYNSVIYIALPTTVSDQGIYENVDDGALSDIVIISMHEDWSFDPVTDVRTITAEPDDRENYVTGLKTNGSNFFVTYKQSVGNPPAGENRGWIKVFSKDFNLLYSEKVKTTVWGPNGGELRPSLEVVGNRVLSGQSSGEGLAQGNAEIYMYDIITTSVDDNNVGQPSDYLLYQNYPNPFNPATTISYKLPINSFVTLRVYDELGREVATLVNEEKAPGNYEVKFDGSSLSSGIYFYRLQAGEYSAAKKLILLK